MELSDIRIMNAAGWCKDLAEVERLARSPVTEITIGSITAEPRAGNSGTTFWQAPDGTYALNSLGLPNGGLEHYRRHLPEMTRVIRGSGKKVRLSVAGFTPKEYEHIVGSLAMHADTIELNLGCPNVWGTGGQKPIASFDLELMVDIVSRVTRIMGPSGVHRAVKLSPYSDPAMVERVVRMLMVNSDCIVDEIVVSNTFPNGYAFGAAGGRAITPAHGLAGVSGKAMKGIVLGQVRMACDARGTIGPAVVGVGGISSGQDVLEMLNAGAAGVQIGTHYFVHGPKVFGEILAELAG